MFVHWLYEQKLPILLDDDTNDYDWDDVFLMFPQDDEMGLLIQVKTIALGIRLVASPTFNRIVQDIIVCNEIFCFLITLPEQLATINYAAEHIPIDHLFMKYLVWRFCDEAIEDITDIPLEYFQQLPSFFSRRVLLHACRTAAMSVEERGNDRKYYREHNDGLELILCKRKHFTYN